MLNVKSSIENFKYILKFIRERERERDRQTERQTDRQTDREREENINKGEHRSKKAAPNNI